MPLRRHSPALLKRREVPYGREAYSVAQELNITVSEAQALIDRWAEMYPEAWLYLEECAKTALRGEPLVTPLGRYRRFGLITEESAQSISNEAKNFKIQSVSSDLTLLSGIQLYKDLRSTFGARVINIVHDSLVIECKDEPEIILGVAEMVKRVMSETPIKWLNATVPFGVDVELGYNWADIVDLKYYVEAGHSVAGALALKCTS